MSSAQKNAQFFNFSVLDSVLCATATTNKLLWLPPLFHFLHLCSSIYNIVMSRRQHGKRSQEVCIDLIDQYRTDYPTAPLECILHSISTRHHVSTRQLRRWYYHYLEWGEYQYQTRAKIQHFRRKYRSLYRSRTVTDEIVAALREIINNNPEYYLDEIAVELVKKVGVYLPFSTFYKTITKRLKYSLQVCYEAAKQRNEMERRRYKEALQIVVKDPRQVLVIDEAHKDKRASRRRRTWGRRNSGGVALLKWFRSKVRYTMITGISI